MVSMWWRRSWLLALFLLAAFSPYTLSAQTTSAISPEQPLASVPPPPKPAVAPTRFVIGLDHETRYHLSSLPNPNRVIVDLEGVGVRLPAEPKGLVKSFHGGLSAPGRTRVVIEVTVPVIVEKTEFAAGANGKTPSLVLDIVPVDSEALASKEPAKKVLMPPSALGAVGLQPPIPKPAVRPSQLDAKTYRNVVVIDPGHGGHDTGAEKNGAIEKEVVLAFAKVLRDKLVAKGYKVFMTRETDVFIELGDRLTFASQHKADLFIAIHADYAKTQARGATIYSLRDSVAKSLKSSTKGSAKNKVLSEAEDDITIVQKASGDIVQKASGDVEAVKGFLSGLIENLFDSTRDETSLFSRSLVKRIDADDSTTLRDDPDKQASFRVLKTAEFPSVLVELAYVTNKEDAEQLKSDAWRDKVATSIEAAVGNFFADRMARLVR